MATAAQMVAKAASQIGYKESPAGSNNTKYGRWYGMNYEPWCAMFVSWCANEIGESKAVGKFAYCPYWVGWFKKNGTWLDRSAKPQPGDIIFFSNGKRACHVGVVEERLGTDYVRTIEGNTSTSSNDNGGAVMRRKRAYGKRGSSWFIMGFGRPKYSGTPKPKPKPLPIPKQPASKPLNDNGCYYSAHVQRAGWMPTVHDGMIAGSVGYSARCEAIKICPPEGVTLDVDVHLQSVGWKTYKGIKRGVYEPTIGTTGESRRLEAIRIRTVKNSANKAIRYRAHVQKQGWQDWRNDGQIAGTTGQKLRLEAVQIYFE